MTKVTNEVPEGTESKLERDTYSVIVSIRNDKGYLWDSKEHWVQNLSVISIALLSL